MTVYFFILGYVTCSCQSIMIGRGDLSRSQFWGAVGLPWWLRWQSILLQCRRPKFNPWVTKISSRKEWQPSPVFLPGEPPWTEEPGGFRSTGSQRVRHDWTTNTFNSGGFLCIQSLTPVYCASWMEGILRHQRRRESQLEGAQVLW